MSTFVLVHGAWNGGWCWKWVRALLEQQGHHVYTPTMTGLGEREHLLSDTVSLDTVTLDIINVIEYENLYNVILVGHSFGGVVITAVADRIPERIARLVYLDAAILEDGESMFSKMPEHLADARRTRAQASSAGLTMSVPTAEDMGIVDSAQWAFVKRYLTPHPIKTYESTLHLKNPPGDQFPCSYIVCANPVYTPLQWARDRISHYGWPTLEIATGHCAMISAPSRLLELIIQQPEYSKNAQTGVSHEQ